MRRAPPRGPVCEVRVVKATTVSCVEIAPRRIGIPIPAVRTRAAGRCVWALAAGPKNSPLRPRARWQICVALGKWWSAASKVGCGPFLGARLGLVFPRSASRRVLFNVLLEQRLDLVRHIGDRATVAVLDLLPDAAVAVARADRLALDRDPIDRFVVQLDPLR